MADHAASATTHVASATTGHGHGDVRRRDFIHVASGAFAVGGAAIGIWPFVSQMGASADVKAMSSIEVDISKIPEGSGIVVKYLGNPMFIRHRTKAQVASLAQFDSKPANVEGLRDPQTDSTRVKQGKEQWLIVSGSCTHLGCIPMGNKPTDNGGEFGGYFCPCHGSHYDVSGRIRKGPAPKNLEVPEYAFLSDTKIKIG
jgi:ubiquinol-cytochrome c reductase iron-sulfur subunit